MEEKKTKIRHIDRKTFGDELPVIIDPHQMKPVVDNMELEGKPTEEKIIDLILFTTQAKSFHAPTEMEDDEYTVTQSMLPIQTDKGNCRQRTAMLSALLESAGIDHEIVKGWGLGANHPTLHVDLGNGKLEIDYAGSKKSKGKMVARITFTEKGEHNDDRWEIHQDGSIEKTNQPWIVKEHELDKVESFRNWKGFQDGFNRMRLERLITSMKKEKPE